MLLSLSFALVKGRLMMFSGGRCCILTDRSLYHYIALESLWSSFSLRLCCLFRFCPSLKIIFSFFHAAFHSVYHSSSIVTLPSLNATLVFTLLMPSLLSSLMMFSLYVSRSSMLTVSIYLLIKPYSMLLLFFFPIIYFLKTFQSSPTIDPL